MNGQFDIQGKHIVITGACGGIGKCVVKSLAENDAELVLIGRNMAKLEALQQELAGVKTHLISADLSKIEDVNRCVAEIEEKVGTVDVLINSAGTNIRKHFLEVKPEDYDTVMDLNAKGLYFISQGIAKLMAKANKGKIINIASLNTFIALSTVSIYAASKGAVGQMTKAMAVDLARYNIQVNAVAPGFIQTPFNELLWGNPEKNAWISERTLAKRFGVPEDLTGTVQFLASQASDFMTGQVLLVDGGFLTGADTLFG